MVRHVGRTGEVADAGIGESAVVSGLPGELRSAPAVQDISSVRARVPLGGKEGRPVGSRWPLPTGCGRREPRRVPIRHRAVSSAHPDGAGGGKFVPPFWSTLVKHSQLRTRGGPNTHWSCRRRGQCSGRRRHPQWRSSVPPPRTGNYPARRHSRSGPERPPKGLGDAVGFRTDHRFDDRSASAGRRLRWRLDTPPAETAKVVRSATMSATCQIG